MKTETLTVLDYGDRTAGPPIVAAAPPFPQARLRSLARTLAKGRPGVQADDLMQEGWLELQRPRAQFEANGRISATTWAHYVARWGMLEYLRSHSTRARSLDERRTVRVTPEMIQSMPCGTSSPETQARQAEREAALRSALRSLSWHQQRVLELWLDGLSFSEIGERLRIRKQAAHSAYRMALDRLRRYAHLRRAWEEL